MVFPLTLILCHSLIGEAKLTIFKSASPGLLQQLQTAESTALLSGSGSLPSPSLKRQARSAPAPLSGHLINYSQHQEDADTPDSLSQLLARLISRKGSAYHTRSSLSSRASGLPPNHRIKDRDYLGWMDFGRRSAEEYEY
uniref:Cholecystokinin n=1 Tax=Oreochromis niloticus TaxID=8128 RepID=A0A669B846_ORENI